MLAPDRPQQRDQQLEVGHRRLVDDQQVGVDLVLGRALAGDPAERGVDRRRVHPGRLRHPPRRAAGRGDQRDRRVLRLGRRADQPDRRRLAGAGAAGDDREPRRRTPPRPRPTARARGRGPRRRARARRRALAGAGPAAGRLRTGSASRRRRIVVGQLGLQRGGRRPVGPDDAVASLSSTIWPAADMSCSSSASGAGPPSSRGRRSRGPGTGRQVEPSRSASLSTWMTAARRAADRVARDAGGARDRVRDRRTRRRTRSSARTGGVRTTSCARSPYSAAIRGTSHARPCGASSRCSARVERSAFHERIASLTRFGFSPATRNARAGSSSIASSTSSP